MIENRLRPDRCFRLARICVAFPLLLGAILAASATAVDAQVGTCWQCTWSAFPGSEWPSWMCTGKFSGANDCMEVGNSRHHTCEPYGGDCDVGTDEETDQQVVSMVIGGRMLPADGSYIVVADRGESVILRKCDRSLVARIAAQLLADPEGGSDVVASVIVDDRLAMAKREPRPLAAY